jgi:cytochrome c biogenesis protein CcdA/thiol-disulfide isomerase/thioredoxin
MLLLIGFAFLAGIVTVLSPCILPVLPVVLSGGVGGGKARPWGIITGFIASFTIFTLTLSTLVQTLGLNPDLLRWISAALVLLFGIVLVVPALKDGFLAITTRLVARSSAPVKMGKAPGGYWSGLILGLGLGLVWTPCVGPIMASVITLALSQSVDAGSIFITLAYTLGTAIPLFLIMLGGRTLLQKAPWFTRHSSSIQRGFGVLMVATALALFTGADRAFSSWLLEVFPSYGSGLTAIENQDSVKKELSKRTLKKVQNVAVQEPDRLTLGKGVWINSPPLTLEELKGKVVLVDFWTYSCINCVRTLPYLRAWYSKYQDQGFVIVGVHSPEFVFEQSEANVRQAVKDLKVSWPVVQDNAFGIWNAYQNQYWPAHYLYDRGGKLIETHYGEGDYSETEAAIAGALGGKVAQAGTPVADAVPISEGAKTPETYLGYGRGTRFSSPEAVMTDKSANYTVPRGLPVDHWAYGGNWTVTRESASGDKGSSLVLHYQGARVYLVVGPARNHPVRIHVKVDGIPQKDLQVDGQRMYTAVDEPEKSGGVLQLDFEGPTQVYAFTFG